MTTFSREQIRKKMDELVKAANYEDANFIRDHASCAFDGEILDELDFDSVHFLTIMNYNDPGGKNLYEQE